jgi:hypothetical protein
MLAANLDSDRRARSKHLLSILYFIMPVQVEFWPAFSSIHDPVH